MTLNPKTLAAHIVAYAGGLLAILNVVAAAAPSVHLPAAAQAWIGAAVAVLTTVVELAKPAVAQAIAAHRAAKQ